MRPNTTYPSLRKLKHDLGFNTEIILPLCNLNGFGYNLSSKSSKFLYKTYKNANI